ncbi:syntabulin-like [Phalacrocorax aristotelis]|uniref:syntabulin-like n=1 Tax=Phalacrocorax aristotelis TaxID=126867 RepID=UPI003F4BA847
MSSATSTTSLPSGLAVLTTFPDVLFIPEIIFGGLVWILVASSKVQLPMLQGWVMFVSVFCFVMSITLLCLYICGAHGGSSSWVTLAVICQETASLFYRSMAVLEAYSTYISFGPANAVMMTVYQENVAAVNYGASLASRSNSGSNKGSDSSQVTRRSGKSISCGHNCSTKPENPERYLTPLQQKEVTIRHLKIKLKESECKVTEREREIEKLKAQVERMKEDWIEDECNHVEMELSLLEARREIKELKQVIESMKNSLAEKDKKFQKYFLEISIENKKLESLVSSMEMALKSSVRDEQRPEYTCDSEGKPLCTTMPDSPTTEDQALEELADSGLFLHEDTANGTDLFEESLTTTTPELNHFVDQEAVF